MIPEPEFIVPVYISVSRANQRAAALCYIGC